MEHIQGLSDQHTQLLQKLFQPDGREARTS